MHRKPTKYQHFLNEQLEMLIKLRIVKSCYSCIIITISREHNLESPRNAQRATEMRREHQNAPESHSKPQRAPQSNREATRGSQRHRKPQRAPGSHRETQGATERPREAHRGTESYREPQAVTESPRKPQRGPERPTKRQGDPATVAPACPPPPRETRYSFGS